MGVVIQSTDEKVKDILENNENVVIKFYADWCGVCRLIAPKYNKLANKSENEEVTFLDINAEHNPVIRKEVQVSNLPFFAIFKNGELVESNFTSKIEKIQSMIDSNLR